MTFREFNLVMMRDAILGKLLPLELRRTYPRLSLDGPVLCASFAGFRIAPEKNAVRAYPPAYYLKITYPQCALRSFEKLSAGADDPGGRLMTPRDPADIKRLAELCDQVLKLYDEKSGSLEPAIAAYNALLETILEPEQLTVLDRFTNS